MGGEGCGDVREINGNEMILPALKIFAFSLMLCWSSMLISFILLSCSLEWSMPFRTAEALHGNKYSR